MRALPVGVPKLIVSTIAASDTRPIIGESDMMLAASVVDIAGVNALSARIMANAAAAMAGMVQRRARRARRGAAAGRREPVRGHDAVHHDARARSSRRAATRC